MPLTTYCTQTDMERLFSVDGVKAFSDHDAEGAADTDVISDCINQAAEEINLYALQKYDASSLDDSTLINRWATVLAVKFLCERRGNEVPAGIALEAERIMAKLELIPSGDVKLPGVAHKASFRPMVTNVSVDRRWPASKIRTVPQSSPDRSSVYAEKQIGDVPVE